MQRSPSTPNDFPREIAHRPVITDVTSIITVGLVVGITAGLWWGLGAAAILLAISEVTERMQRTRH